MDREPLKNFFIRFALDLSKRSTCDRAHVGCCIVKDNRIISTGYNGSLPGKEHCDDVGHLLLDGHCIRTIHAEMNAISFAVKQGISLEGSHIFVTHSPCIICTKLIISSGIKKIYYNVPYKIDENKFLDLLETEVLNNE